jgi:hypothetical protein
VADAVFSFLPLAAQDYKILASTFAIVVLILLNLRGVKESVAVLVPVFLRIHLHAIVVSYGIFIHLDTAPTVIATSWQESQSGLRQIGFLGMGLILLRAYSLGGGTYTGIEAVSNGLPILREPRVATGKRTMLYMALSLAFTASGLLLAYLLANVAHEEGKTLNATLVLSLVQEWRLGGVPFGSVFFFVTILSEGALYPFAPRNWISRWSSSARTWRWILGCRAASIN